MLHNLMLRAETHPTLDCGGTSGLLGEHVVFSAASQAASL